MKNSIRKVILPYVTSKQSHEFVMRFQRLCGINEDGVATNKILYYYFKFSSALGEEVCSLIPLMWWYNSHLTIRFMHRFLFLLGAGQLVKDLLELPRPQEGKKYGGIIRLERHFETEYGFPSTHTISGILPVTYILDLLKVGVVTNQLLSYSLGGLYLISIMASRLFVGIHSLPDLLGGLSIGIIFAIILQIDSIANVIEYIFMSSKYAIFVSTTIIWCFLKFYPRAKPWRGGYGTLAQIVGPWYGCCISIYLMRHFTPSVEKELYSLNQHSKEVIKNPSMYIFSTIPGIFLALIAVLLTKITTKYIANKIFVYLFDNTKLLPYDSRENKTPNGSSVPIEKAYYVEVPVRLISYTLLSIVAVYCVPAYSLWVNTLK